MTTRSVEKKPPVHPQSLAKDQFFDNSRGIYFTSLKLPIHNRDWYQVQPTCEWWTVVVGDTIAVACRDSTLPSITGNWFPFLQKWAPAQILALYKNDKGAYQMSFRWLYWHDDLHPNVKLLLKRDEVFEHYTRETYDPLTALGRLKLSTSAAKQGNVIGKDGMPRVFLKCRHAIVKQQKGEVIQNVTDHDTSSSLVRALSLLNDKSLQKETEFAMHGMTEIAEDNDEKSKDEVMANDMEHAQPTCHQNEMTDSDDDEAMLESLKSIEDNTAESDDSSSEVKSPTRPPSSQCSSTPHSSVASSQPSSQASDDAFYTCKEHVSYFWSVQVNVKKRLYSKELSHPISLKQWTLQVGDLVAVKYKYKQDSQDWFPFTTSWSPAQVVALSCEKGDHLVHVRWLYRSHDFEELNGISKTVRQQLDNDRNSKTLTKLVYEHGLWGAICLNAILGRVVLTSGARPSSKFLTNVQDPLGIPQAPLICRSSVSNDYRVITPITDWNKGHTSDLRQLQRGLECLEDEALREASLARLAISRGDDKKNFNETVPCVQSPDARSTLSVNTASTDSFQASSSSTSVRTHERSTWTVNTVSSSQGTSSSASVVTQSSAEIFYNAIDQNSYFRCVQVKTRQRDYSKTLSRPINIPQWTLHLGDLVAVEHEQSSKLTEVDPWYPFTTPWSPAQVVALCYDGGYQVHVRWLYRYQDFLKWEKPSKEVRRQLEADSSLEYDSQFVYEFNRDDRAGLGTILGRLVLTNEPSKQFVDSVQGADGIPQAPLICRCSISGNCDTVTPIKDWDDASTSNLQQLQRGINCLEDKGLRNATLATLTNAKRGESSDSGPNTTDDHSDTERAAPQSSSKPSPPARTVISIGDDDDATLASMEEEQTRPSRQLRLRESFARQAKRTATEEHQDRPKKSARRCDGNEGLFNGALESSVKANVPTNNEPARSRAVAPPDSRVTRKDTPKEDAPKEDSTKARAFIPHGLRHFHESSSTLRSYYSEIHVKPPYGNYEVRSKADEGCEPWVVRMGDSVAVHYEGGLTIFPFKVPSAVANIVAIWKTHEPKNATKSSTGHANRDAGDDIMIEIRWFYRKNELPGSCRAVSVSDNTAKHSEYEEIFETDHMQEIYSTSLLAPVKLHESVARIGSPEMKMLQGMPVLDVHCCRFWSIHRKALLPCGGLAGIVERGRMHSRYLGRSGVLNAALRELEGGLRSQQLEPERKDAIHKSKNWKRAFSDTIEKLGLSDASEDTSVRGIPLTGRDREQEEITAFLRSRIRGDLSGDDDGDSSKNFSLFVAGPPGTGKTASVLSVIARLRLEQAKGKLPAFEFVSLNGMEMRHPFEAYVKFWEIMSGPEKEKKPPDIAAQLLERHFAGLRRDGDQATRPAVVLLLDEIDYLMTKKQSVLYNFFDWPVRSCENENGARLIVVGISNTLNLPSRLKPSVQSRLGGKMCQFRAYNVKDMMAILKGKIQLNKTNSYLVFEDDAIQFAARKAASVSGDIRKALHICKAAAEAVMQEAEAGTRIEPKRGRGGPIVRISDVQKASRESFSSVMFTAVSFSTSLQALLLVSLASLTQTTGRQEGGFDIDELLTKMEAVSGSSGDPQYSPPPTFGETLEMLNRLGETRLVSLHTPKSSGVTFRAAQGGSGGAWPLISLPMDSANILRAFRGTPHSTLADKHVASLGML